MKNSIINVSIIGNTNSGKSTFLNTVIGKTVSITNKKRNTTIESIIGILNTNNTQIIIHDTPGLAYIKSKLQKFRQIKINLWNSIIISNVILYIIDVTKKKISINNDIIYYLKKEKKDIIILLNKVDLINKTKLIPIINDISNEYNLNNIFPISSKKNTGIKSVLQKLIKFAVPGKWLYVNNEKTDKSNLFISKEITRNSLLRNLNDEIPYSLKVINSKWKVIKNKNLVIHQVILIPKLAYKKIILGKNGIMIKKIREYSQKELSKIFNKKIHLYLEVVLEK